MASLRRSNFASYFSTISFMGVGFIQFRGWASNKALHG
jgi:hypothetical protein